MKDLIEKITKSKNSASFSAFSLLCFFSLGFCACDTLPQKKIDGAWIGTVETKPFPDLISLTIDSASAIVKIFYQELDYQPASEFQVKGDRVSLKIESPTFEGTFEGTYEDDSITGFLEVAGEKYSCGFVRTVPVAMGQTAELTGLYEVAPGHVVEASSYIIDFTLNPLLVLDYKTGKKRVAFPQSDLSFTAGKRMLSPYPSDFEITFERGDSGFVMLSSYPGVENGVKGQRLKNLESKLDIEAQNEEVTLKGTITFPETKGDHPLVVFVPGSGMQFRGNILDDFVRLMPYYGIATLIYDKRGCGESTGSLSDYSYQDLANDLTAVIEEASQQSGIDKNRIGVVGIDQAGLIMPAVAAENDLVKFMVNISGSIESMEEQEFRACSLRMEADGFDKDAISDAISYQKLFFSYLKGQTDSLELQLASENVSTQLWSGYVTSFSNKNYVDWWRKNLSFSAFQPLEKLTIPQLSIFGEKDLLIPVRQNTETLEDLYKNKGLVNSKVIVYEGANHLLLLGEKRGDFQFTEIEGYPEGLFDDINTWVADVTGIR